MDEGGFEGQSPENSMRGALRASPYAAWTHREARYTLCLSHRKRLQVNATANLLARRQHPEAILIKAAPRALELNRPQDFWCYAG